MSFGNKWRLDTVNCNCQTHFIQSSTSDPGASGISPKNYIVPNFTEWIKLKLGVPLQVSQWSFKDSSYQVDSNTNKIE